MSVAIRAALISDVDGFVNLLKASYRRRYFDLSVMGCSRAPRYLADRIGIGTRDSSRYIVATEAGILIGVAEVRRTRSGIFVNHIAVSHSHQGRGIAGSLLLGGIGMCQVHADDAVELDVFSTNKHAIGWYEGLGMKPVSKRYLFKPNPSAADAGSWWVDDLYKCQLTLSTYGFGSHRLATESGSYLVGVLDSGYVTTKGMGNDEVGICAVSELWSGSMVLSEEVERSSHHALFETSVRLTGQVGQIMSAIKQR